MKKLLLALALIALSAPALYAQGIGGGIFGTPGAPRTVAFANLGTPLEGQWRWCSDCAVTSPCTGSGGGAFAYRVNTVWNCADGAGVTTTTGDARYLKLAADNDPLTAPLSGSAGTAALPSFSFTGEADTGMYLFAANSIGFPVGGVDKWVMSSSGGLNCATDAGCDIGNGSSDPRDINFTRYLLPNGIAFASLGTPANGAITYCTDCTTASPTAGGGTGAIVKRENGAWNAGGGGGSLTAQALTAGSLTGTASNVVRAVTVASFAWVASDINTTAVTALDVKVATLPAKTVVTNAYIYVASHNDGAATTTIALGRTGATYIDYLVATTMTNATLIGEASADRGTNLTGYDLPSWTATTDVYLHFIISGDDMTGISSSAGTVVIEYYVIP